MTRVLCFRQFVYHWSRPYRRSLAKIQGSRSVNWGFGHRVASSWKGVSLAAVSFRSSLTSWPPKDTLLTSSSSLPRSLVEMWVLLQKVTSLYPKQHPQKQPQMSSSRLLSEPQLTSLSETSTAVIGFGLDLSGILTLQLLRGLQDGMFYSILFLLLCPCVSSSRFFFSWGRLTQLFICPPVHVFNSVNIN